MYDCFSVCVCYLCVCRTGEPPAEASVTARILQTEAGFVSLSHFPALRIQEVIVTEGIHAMIVSGERERERVCD